MAFPPIPTVPSGIRENTTPQVNLHPQDHTEIHQALSDIINELGDNPSGDAPSLTAWLKILCPVGIIQAFGGASAPSGWAMCNGDPVSRVTYADLFAVIGVNFGGGDGSTTFNLPNFRGRSPMGQWAGGPYAGALGGYIGSADATLVSHGHGSVTGNDSPDHAHNLVGNGAYATDGGAHNHNFGGGTRHWWLDPLAWTLPPNTLGANGGDSLMGLADWVEAPNHTHGLTGFTAGASVRHTHSITVEGVSATNANVQPNTVCNFIIRMT